MSGNENTYHVLRKSSIISSRSFTMIPALKRLAFSAAFLSRARIAMHWSKKVFILPPCTGKVPRRRFNVNRRGHMLFCMALTNSANGMLKARTDRQFEISCIQMPSDRESVSYCIRCFVIYKISLLSYFLYSLENICSH